MSTSLAADYQADYIIIGAGTAGCVLANRLSANPANKVLLIEAGGKDNYPWIKIPIGYLFTMNNPKTDWCFKTEPDEGLNGRALNYPRGKTLGGCSSINGMIYMRGQSQDYQHWKELGNPGWGWEDVLPYFKKSEDHWAGESEFHGAGGEWRVEKQRLSWPILDNVMQAAGEIGIEQSQDYNDGDNLGFCYFEVNQKKGRRWSSANAFLHPISHRKNLTVITHTQAERLEIADKQVIGVHLRQGKVISNATALYARAAKEVILTAGAIASPMLLQRSGIAAKALLDSLDIKQQHDLAGVGENLQDHLQVRMVFKLDNANTLNELSHSVVAKAKMGIEYALFRSGPLSMAPSQMGGFAKSSAEHTSSNIEYHVQPLSCDKLGDPLDKFPAVTASVCNLRPKSVGHVHLSSKDITSKPIIKANYLSHPEDKQVAIDSLKLTRKIFQAQSLSSFNPLEYKPGIEIQSDQALLKAAGDLGTTIFHPVGTCKMGTDDMSVVNSKLEVHGLKGIRIADASIMPTIVSGNTCSPVIMIAEKAADMILQENQKD
jgi:choline dehydrogenase